MQSTASVEVTVEYRSDAVDEAILATWCDPELQKTLNHDKAYLREGSNSSVKLFYAGTNTHPKGVNFNSIDGTLLDEHWSITKEEDPEKAWENAVVSFWVYNPGESALLFCPRINYAATGLDLDWKEELIQEAAPKQWTHIYFSYRALGITANFFFDEDGYFAPGGKQEDDYDVNYMKVQSADAPEDGTKMYSFTAYIDNYDIVAYNDETKDQFPGLDTTKPEESEAYDYTNLQYNEPSGVWKKDTEVHSTGSNYSQKITIEGDYPSIDAKVHLNSANDWKNCDLTDAVMTFDIKFGGASTGEIILSFDKTDSDKSKEVRFSVTNPEGLPAGISVAEVDGADGWYRITIDCSIAKDAFDNEEVSLTEVRKFFITILRTGTEEAWANLDNLFVDMFAKAEEKDLTNLSTNGPSGAFTKDTLVHSVKSDYSQKISIEENELSRTAIFNVGASASGSLDLQKSIVSFDVKFGGEAEEGVIISFDTSDEAVSKEITFPVQTPAGINFTEVAEDWYRITIDCEVIKAEFEDDDFSFADVRNLKLTFIRMDKTKEAWVNFDNLFIKEKAEAENPDVKPEEPVVNEDKDYTNLQYNEPNGAWKKDTEVHSTDSGYSQKITIEGEYSGTNAMVHLNSANDWKNCDLTNAVMTFDVKFGGASTGEIILSFDKTDSDKSKEVRFSVTNPEGLPAGISVAEVDGADGWYRITIDCSVAKDAFENEAVSLNDVRKFIIGFTRTGTEEAWANFDNLFVETKVEKA